MDEAALSALKTKAAGGDAAAMTAWGKRLLLGPPPGHRDAIATLDAAAAKGDGEAAAMVGVLAAIGALTQQSWTAALDYTARAAEFGFEPARSQLRLLAGQGGENWSQLKAAVDVAAWTAPPAKRSLCEAPRIRAIEGFLSPPVCDWLMARAEPHLKAAQVYDPQADGGRVETTRTNTAMEFDILTANLVVLLVRARMAAAMGMPVQAFEHTQVLHYDVGQQFRPHFDWLHPSQAGPSQDIARRGQRIATFLTYLNDDFEGGETDFPRAKVRYKGGKGDALFFANLNVEGQPDPLTLHAGLAPTRGEKWLLSQWVRSQATA